MATHGKPGRAPAPDVAPTTLTEITRRYYACAVALAKAMGVPLSETFLREHRESISCCFIEAGRAGVRLPPAVQLPPLQMSVGDHQMSAGDNGAVPDVPPPPTNGTVGEFSLTVKVNENPPKTVNENSATGAEPPTTIPAGLPCAGQAVGDLKPAQLRMLLSKVDQLAAEQGSQWRPLLEALAAERQTRLQAGKRPTPTRVEGNGHGA
jgi:hypothetical protein